MNVFSIPGDGWHEEEQATIWISNSWKRPQGWWGLDCFYAWQQCVVLVFVQRLGRDCWESESGLSAWCLVLLFSDRGFRANRDIVPAAWWRCCCSFWRWTGVLRFLLGQKVLGDLGWRAAKWMMEGESFVYSLPILKVTAVFLKIDFLFEGTSQQTRKYLRGFNLWLFCSKPRVR